MEIHIAVAKINKYASSESGDTLEAVERPNGGVSVVLSDGQTTGRGAKAISSMAVRKVISLLADGVRDGAAARAASDYLYTERSGKVSATLNIISADLQTGTLVITRNNPSPVFIAQNDRIECLSGESLPIGTSRNIRPAISEFQLRRRHHGCGLHRWIDACWRPLRAVPGYLHPARQPCWKIKILLLKTSRIPCSWKRSASIKAAQMTI